MQARIPRVVMACMNPKAGCAGSVLNILDMPEFNHQVEVTRGVLEQECSAILTQFFKELRVRNRVEKRQGNGTEKSQGNGTEKSQGNGTEKSQGNGTEKSQGNGM